MKLSIFFDHVTQAAEQSGRTLDDLLAAAKAAGIDGADINNANIARNPEMLPAIHRAGMCVACSFEFYDWGGAEYQSYDRFRIHLANAKAEGQDKILVIPGFLSDEEGRALGTLLNEIGIPDSPMIDPRLDAFMRGNASILRMTEMLQGAVKLAAEVGITVSLEDFDGYKAPFARTAGLLWFMQNVEGLRFTLDTGNFIYSDELMEKAHDLLADYIVHVHTKDRGAEEGCTGFRYKQGMAAVATGDGYMPIADAVCKLQAAGYDGWYAIEHYGHPDQAVAILRSAENLLAIGK